MSHCTTKEGGCRPNFLPRTLGSFGLALLQGAQLHIIFVVLCCILEWQSESENLSFDSHSPLGRTACEAFREAISTANVNTGKRITPEQHKSSEEDFQRCNWLVKGEFVDICQPRLSKGFRFDLFGIACSGIHKFWHLESKILQCCWPMPQASPRSSPVGFSHASIYPSPCSPRIDLALQGVVRSLWCHSPSSASRLRKAPLLP